MNEKERLREILRKLESIGKQDSWIYWMLAVIITLLICNFITLIFIYFQPVIIELIVNY